ncbi:MAG: hypothetical protein LUP95_01510 [Euryarchaeota archaeon]|nr:hypothetical protein [Euryarchaeota archaeon]
MKTPFDVEGTIAAKAALVIVVLIAAGLVLAFTPLSVIGYLLLAAAAVLYIIVSVRAVSLKK